MQNTIKSKNKFNLNTTMALIRRRTDDVVSYLYAYSEQYEFKRLLLP